MAISIISTPNNYEPVYTNSIPFVISSTFQNEVNFKYIFVPYVNGTIKSIVTTYPRPTSGGIYSPHYILQANTNTDLSPTLVGIKDNQLSQVKYYFRLGEQYNPVLTFSDTILSGTFLGLTFSTNISTQLFTGDIITVRKDNISINPSFNGTASITSILNNFSIETDKSLSSPVFSSNESGSILNISRLSATTSTYYGWNAARQYGDFSDFYDTYILDDSSSTKKLLSSYETSYDSDFTLAKPIFIDSYETLDFMISTQSVATYSDVYLTFNYYDSTNTLLGKDIILYGGIGASLRYVCAAGTQNITNISGSGAGYISSGSLDNYSVTIGLGDGISATPSVNVSDPFNYKVVPKCSPYDNIRLTFLNKLGGYDYWDFNLVSRFTSDINRTQINRALSPTYLKGDRGRDIIYSSAVENWTINTDFLLDTNALFIRELVESPSVFVIESDGSVIPIVITKNSWDYKSGLLDGYVQYTITFQKSNDVYINR